MIFFRSKKGFTIAEVLFAAVIGGAILGTMIGVWTYAYRNWSKEDNRTELRIDMLKAIETIKKDLRLSSLTYMSFYPAGGEPYAAVSLPVAETDANGFFTLDASNNIDWDATVIYHIFTEADGTKTLRRTVIDPRDNTMTEDARYAELESVVVDGAGGASSTTNTEFLKNVDTFELSSLSPIIDFYDSSSSAVRVGKVVFGWVKLSSGSHTIRFEIAGKNDSSSGYGIGIDTLMIEPSGSVRDFEYYNSSYAPGGSISVSGGGASRVYDPIWSNDNYLDFSATGVGDYVEIADSYDLWRESAFDNAGLNNTEFIEEEVRLALDVPDDDIDGAVTWFAHGETGDEDQDGSDGSLPGAIVPPISIRTVVTHDNIDVDGDMVRVKFKASSDETLVIDSAYITKRNGTSGPNGLANLNTSGLSVEEYHRHQQLFFKDDAGIVSTGTTIAAGGEKWSVWTAFPIRTASDYLITVHISNVSSDECTYWDGSVGTDRTYYVVGGTYAVAGTPDWSSQAYVADNNVYITANIDVWQKNGSVESQIFDTSLSAPVYNQIKWSESCPSGASVILKSRSSSDSQMTGATAWSDIIGSGTNPHSLSAGSGRYIQFEAELSCEPSWKVSSTAQTYTAYIDDQVNSYADYDFPSLSGTPYTTTSLQPWVDDVEIDWPGTERICTLTGYVAKKSDYGQAKVLVDGVELTKILSVHMKVSKDVSGATVSEENYAEVEPRNTGK